MTQISESMADRLQTDIKFLSGVGPKRAELLSSELNIRTFEDLLSLDMAAVFRQKSGLTSFA